MVNDIEDLEYSETNKEFEKWVLISVYRLGFLAFIDGKWFWHRLLFGASQYLIKYYWLVRIVVDKESDLMFVYTV